MLTEKIWSVFKVGKYLENWIQLISNDMSPIFTVAGASANPLPYSLLPVIGGILMISFSIWLVYRNIRQQRYIIYRYICILNMSHWTNRISTSLQISTYLCTWWRWWPQLEFDFLWFPKCYFCDSKIHFSKSALDDLWWPWPDSASPIMPKMFFCSSKLEFLEICTGQHPSPLAI